MLLQGGWTSKVLLWWATDSAHWDRRHHKLMTPYTIVCIDMDDALTPSHFVCGRWFLTLTHSFKACPHWCFKLHWCGLNLDQSCPHLIHIAWKWIVSRSKLDWASPCTVGGLDLDQKWIITGNEVSLIETHVCRCQVVVGVYKKEPLLYTCMYGEQTVSKACWMGYPGTRLCKYAITWP